jgi:hypothetical protein
LHKLNGIPGDLPGVYTKILRDIGKDYQAEARDILQWLVYSIRPLILKELGVTIAVPPTHTCASALETERNLEHYLRLLFGPLVKVEQEVTVHLVHQSVKDFLSDTDWLERHSSSDVGIEEDPWALFYTSPLEVNCRLATTCFTYLSFEEFEQAVGNKLI